MQLGFMPNGNKERLDIKTARSLFLSSIPDTPIRSVQGTRRKMAEIRHVCSVFISLFRPETDCSSGIEYVNEFSENW